MKSMQILLSTPNTGKSFSVSISVLALNRLRSRLVREKIWVHYKFGIAFWTN